MRHAEAAPSLGSDADRDLTEAGLADARLVGAWLSESIGHLDVVLCSAALRTRRTWSALQDAGVTAGRVEITPALYEASTSDLRDELAGVDDDARSVLLLGHAPGVPSLASWLVGRRGDPAALAQLDRGFPTATLARLTLTTPWNELGSGSAQLSGMRSPERF